MKKILLVMLLLLLPAHAFALPHFYVGVGTVSGNSGEKKTIAFENGSDLAISSSEYQLHGGYGLSLGFSFDNVSVENRWFSYRMKDDDAPPEQSPIDIIEQTTHIVGRIGTDFLGVRLSMGFGEAKATPGDTALPKAKFDVLSKGIGVDLKLSLLGKTRIFVDYYDNSYKNTDIKNNSYQRDARDHSLVYFGMAFPLKLGSIFGAATP